MTSYAFNPDQPVTPKPQTFAQVKPPQTGGFNVQNAGPNMQTGYTGNQLNYAGTRSEGRYERADGSTGYGGNPAYQQQLASYVPKQLPQTGGFNVQNAGSVPGQTTFSSGSNLIGSQFNPQASDRLNGAAGMTNNAASNFANIQNPGAVGVSGPDYSRARAAMGSIPTGNAMYGYGGGSGGDAGTQSAKMREMTMADLEKVRSGSDRGKLAGDAYNLMEERGRPEFEQRVRQLGQNTAALGRIGSGVYGSNLTDLNSERERELGLGRRELANSAAGSSLADRLNILSATQGVAGDISQSDARMSAMNAAMNAGASADQWKQYNAGMDRARMEAGFADSDYGARFSERGYGDQRSDANFDRARSQFTTLGDYEQGIRGNERSDRNEMRDERNYQQGLERDARRDFEADQQWNYGVGRDKVDDQRYAFDQMKEFGYGGNPSGAQRYASGQAAQSGQAGMQGLGDSLGEYMYQQQMRNRQGGGQLPQGQQHNGAVPRDRRTV